MAKERKASAWETNDEEVRWLFLLTLDDLYVPCSIRTDAQRLYRALVLLWARVKRALLSETRSILALVNKQVSKPLGLSTTVLEALRNAPSEPWATVGRGHQA